MAAFGEPAGAPEGGRPIRPRLVGCAAVVVIASLFMAGCDSNDSGAPLTLMTGARAPEPATHLEGVGGRGAVASWTAAGAGAPRGSAGVEPDPGTRFVAVEQDGYVEVYETAAGLPIRVTTSDVDIERSSAEFRISEDGSDGHLIRRYRL